MRGQTYVIIAIFFMLVVAVFAVINVNTVQVNYLFWQVDSPLILVILFSALMGGIITGAAGMVKMFKIGRKLKRLKKENETLIQIMNENGLNEKMKNTFPENE